MKKILSFLLCCMTFTTFAELPLFSIIGTPAFTFNTTYSYTVTNNAIYALTNIAVRYAPIGKTPPGFTQITTGTNACTNPFNLNAGASCTLYYSIQLADTINNSAIGGPEICYNVTHPIYCSVPSSDSQIDLQFGSLSLLAGVSSDTAYFIQTYGSTGMWGPSPPPVPALPSQSYYRTAECNESLCVMAGTITANYDHPFLASSIDQGLSWQTLDLTTPTGRFISSGCRIGANEPCFVGGYTVVTTPTNYIPSLYQYDYGTATWLPQTLLGTGVLYAGGCGTDYCLAGGTNNVAPPASGVYIYHTESNVWIQTPYDATILNSLQFNLHGVSCQGSLCLAMGSYNTTTASDYYSFVLQYDGTSWTPPVQLLTAVGPFRILPSGSQVEGPLSCTGNFCVAGGDNTATVASKLIQSYDFGSTWTEVTSLGVLAGGAYNSVSCSATICVAVASAAGQGQILGQTTNQGITWTFIPITLASTVNMTTANCRDNFCFISGVDQNSGVAIVYQTPDAGVTWTPAKFNSVAPITTYNTGATQ